MISEVDLKDFDMGEVRPLYKVKPRSYIQIPGEAGVYFFDHIDGMYSYCLNAYGMVVHLSATLPVQVLDRKEHRKESPTAESGID